MVEFLTFETTVEAAYTNIQAKDYLARKFNLSRSRIKAIRLRGALYLNGQSSRMIDRLKGGDHLRAVCPDLRSPELRLEALKEVNAELIYEDPWLLVINKPHNLLVHPSYQEEHSLTRLLSSQKLHPVRRLDRDSSGLVPIALNPHAHEQLQNQKSSKRYRILVHGRLPEKQLRVVSGIKRNPRRSIQRIAGGQENLAISNFQEWAYFPELDVSLLDLYLESGRTHQIRAHALYLGLPLLGDWLYGRSGISSLLESAAEFYSIEAKLRLQKLQRPKFKLEDDYGFTRQALDADCLEFINPYDGKLKSFTCPWPEDFQAFFKKYGLEAGPRPK